MAEQIIFFIAASLAILSSLNVILSYNPVRSVLALILTFFFTAILWIVLGAEFLGMTLILVYVGAVLVLFLFVIMMLNINSEIVIPQLTKYWSTTLIIVTLLFASLFSLVMQENHMYKLGIQQTQQTNNIKALGHLLFRDYLLEFEIAGILLFIGIVVAIVLSQKPVSCKKQQKVFEQIQVCSNDRIKMLDLKEDLKL